MVPALRASSPRSARSWRPRGRGAAQTTAPCPGRAACRRRRRPRPSATGAACTSRPTRAPASARRDESPPRTDGCAARCWLRRRCVPNDGLLENASWVICPGGFPEQLPLRRQRRSPHHHCCPSMTTLFGLPALQCSHREFFSIHQSLARIFAFPAISDYLHT